MGMMGITELLVILAIVLLLFGSTQLPKLAKGFGESLTIFRKAVHEESEKDKSDESSGASEGAEE